MTCCLRFPRFSAVPPLRGSLRALPLLHIACPCLLEVRKDWRSLKERGQPGDLTHGKPAPSCGISGLRVRRGRGRREDAASPAPRWFCWGGGRTVVRGTCFALCAEQSRVSLTPLPSPSRRWATELSPTCYNGPRTLWGLCPSRGGKGVVRATC